MDIERENAKKEGRLESLPPLHGIPISIKEHVRTICLAIFVIV